MKHTDLKKHQRLARVALYEAIGPAIDDLHEAYGFARLPGRIRAGRRANIILTTASALDRLKRLRRFICHLVDLPPVPIDGFPVAYHLNDEGY